MQSVFVESESELDRLCDQARALGRIAMDTEFVRDNVYFPKLALFQIAVGRELRCIDPFSNLSLDALHDVLLDPNVTVIVHAGAQDLEILLHRLGTPPRAIFDTQMAAAMVGFGSQMAYAALVHKVLGRSVARSEGMTDWLKRPLSRAQIRYALDDVRHLLELHDALQDALHEAGRAEWCRQEFQRLEDPEAYAIHSKDPYQYVKGHGKLRGRRLAALKRLAVWREDRAKSLDIPRRRVLADAFLVELAQRLPKSKNDIRKIRQISSRDVSIWGEDVLHAVQRSMRDPIDEDEGDRSAYALRPETRLAADVLKAALRAHCHRAHIAPALVATTSDLETLARVVLQGDGDPSTLLLAQGWRRDLIGQHLLAMLRGDVAMKLTPENGLPVFFET